MVPANMSWRKPKTFQQEIPRNVRNWLLDPGSFMQRLKRYGVHYPRIRVLYQGWQFPTKAERQRLKLAPRQFAFIREVQIASEAKPLMYARTVFPKKLLRGKWLCFKQLKTKSLGSVLFKNNFKRSQFEIVNFPKQTAQWVRRSLFTRGKQSLLLNEIFIADVFKL